MDTEALVERFWMIRQFFGLVFFFFFFFISRFLELGCMLTAVIITILRRKNGEEKNRAFRPKVLPWDDEKKRWGGWKIISLIPAIAAFHQLKMGTFGSEKKSLQEMCPRIQFIFSREQLEERLSFLGTFEQCKII